MHLSPILLTGTCSFSSFYSVLLFLLCFINLVLCFSSGSPALAGISFCFTAMVAFQTCLYLSSIHFYLLLLCQILILHQFLDKISFALLAGIQFMPYQLNISSCVRESHLFPQFSILTSLSFQSFSCFYLLPHFLLKVTILYFLKRLHWI